MNHWKKPFNILLLALAVCLLLGVGALAAEDAAHAGEDQLLLGGDGRLGPLFQIVALIVPRGGDLVNILQNILLVKSAHSGAEQSVLCHNPHLTKRIVEKNKNYPYNLAYYTIYYRKM